MSDLPLFIPLCARYYDGFVSGNKDTEYRLFGARWNHKTCRVGRAVTLSRGYGKKNRASTHIKSTDVVKLDSLPGLLEISMRALLKERATGNPEIIAIRMAEINPSPPVMKEEGR